MIPTGRLEFSKSTKKVIAGRAGFRCSFPDCGMVTIGPGAEPDQTASTGVASHIFAASPAGPRGDGGLSEERIKSPENGIWLCETHAKLVDTNEGEKYPPSLLIGYKSLHETRIAREQGGVTTPFGWVQRISVAEGPVFRCPVSLELGKVTLLLGKNGTGKTTLCDWLAGASSPTHLQRWLPDRTTEKRITYSIDYYGSEPHKVDVELAAGKVSFTVDKQSFPYNPVAFRTVYLQQQGHRSTSGLSFLKDQARRLGVDQLIVKNLIEAVGPRVNCRVSRAYLDDDDRCHVALNNRDPHPFGSLSSGEKECVALELAMALADFEAQYNPTLLLIDAAVPAMDRKLAAYYGRRLTKPGFEFQTILAAVPRSRAQDWAGWEVAQLRKTGEGSKVTQDQVGV